MTASGDLDSTTCPATTGWWTSIVWTPSSLSAVGVKPETVAREYLGRDATLLPTAESKTQRNGHWLGCPQTPKVPMLPECGKKSSNKLCQLSTALANCVNWSELKLVVKSQNLPLWACSVPKHPPTRSLQNSWGNSPNDVE